MNPHRYRVAIAKDGTHNLLWRSTMFVVSLRRSVGTAFASLALATAACGGDDSGSTGPSTPAPSGSASGVYALTSLRTLGHLGGGGNGLPVTFTDGGGSTLTFKSGELVMTPGGAYSLAVKAEFNGSAITMSDEGHYSVAGSSIDFDPTGSPKRMKDGTISGNKITAQTQFGGIPFEIKLAK
jgi:hypothetical protein